MACRPYVGRRSAASHARCDDDAGKPAEAIRVGITRASPHTFVDARSKKMGRIGEAIALVAANRLAAAFGLARVEARAFASTRRLTRYLHRVILSRRTPERIRRGKDEERDHLCDRGMQTHRHASRITRPESRTAETDSVNAKAWRLPQPSCAAASTDTARSSERAFRLEESHLSLRAHGGSTSRSAQNVSRMAAFGVGCAP